MEVLQTKFSVNDIKRQSEKRSDVMRISQHGHSSLFFIHLLASSFVATLLSALRLPERLPALFSSCSCLFVLRASRLSFFFARSLHFIEQNFCPAWLAKKILVQSCSLLCGRYAGQERILSILI